MLTAKETKFVDNYIDGINGETATIKASADIVDFACFTFVELDANGLPVLDKYQREQPLFDVRCNVPDEQPVSKYIAREDGYMPGERRTVEAMRAAVELGLDIFDTREQADTTEDECD